MRWFKNLKKWQKGGIIGGAVGLILAGIIILSPHRDSLGEWIANFHAVFFIETIGLLNTWGSAETLSGSILDYIGSAAIVIFYGGIGILVGMIQQMAKPARKWLLTALLALFLLLFYMLNVIYAMILR